MIIFTVISGMGYQYFKEDLIIGNCYVNMKVMFGCGIGLSLGFIMGLVGYCACPGNFCCNFLFWGPMFVLCALYITYTRPSLVDVYTEYYGDLWDEDNAELDLMAIQFHHKCCGWENATDRGLVACPYDYVSGCSNTVREYLLPRMDEIFVCSIVTLSVATVAAITLFILTSVSGEEDFFEVMDWFFNF